MAEAALTGGGMSYAKKCDACGWTIERAEDECPNCVGHLGIDGQPIMRGPGYIKLPLRGPNFIDPLSELVFRSRADAEERARQAALYRYRNEPIFNHLVKSLVCLILDGKMD